MPTGSFLERYGTRFAYKWLHTLTNKHQRYRDWQLEVVALSVREEKREGGGGGCMFLLHLSVVCVRRCSNVLMNPVSSLCSLWLIWALSSTSSSVSPWLAVCVGVCVCESSPSSRSSSELVSCMEHIHTQVMLQVELSHYFIQESSTCIQLLPHYKLTTI